VESLRRALALLESLSKVQRTPTFPGLGVPDDRRSTTIVTNPQQVRLRNRLMDHESKRIFGPDSIRPTTDSDRSGLASNVAPISYSKSNALRAQTDDWLRATSRHPYDELSTSLHEDMHQIFADQESKDLALAHDQAMKRGLRHLQTIAPRVNQEWTEWTAAHDPQMVARIKEAGGKVGKPEGIEAEGKQHQALSELWR